MNPGDERQYKLVSLVHIPSVTFRLSILIRRKTQDEKVRLCISVVYVSSHRCRTTMEQN